jgi:hypothetical protein
MKEKRKKERKELEFITGGLTKKNFVEHGNVMRRKKENVLDS